MNKYYFIFLIWLLPAYFLLQGGYQIFTYFGIQTTYQDGESYLSEVIDFDVKQIAAQTNGYVVIRFSTASGETIEERLALPVQMAQVVMQSELIPVRYQKTSFKPIVLIPVYDLQLSVIKVNLAVTGFGFLVTVLIALWASKFAVNRIKYGETVLDIEHIETENQ